MTFNKKEYDRKYYQNHKERIKENVKNWYKNNLKKVRAYRKKKYFSNAPLYRKLAHNWYRKNRKKAILKNREYHRTPIGWLSKVYATMKHKSKKRKMPLPSFSKQELEWWINKYHKKKLKRLFNNWKKNKYKIDLIPSINRLNNYKPYTLSNIELVTWKINNDKGHISCQKKVIQKDLDNNLIAEYPSIIQASIKNNCKCYNISSVCKGKRNKCAGFKWEYKK